MKKILFQFLLVLLTLTGCDDVSSSKSNTSQDKYNPLRPDSYVLFHPNGKIKMVVVSKDYKMPDYIRQSLILDTISELKKYRTYQIYLDSTSLLESMGPLDSSLVRKGIWHYYHKNNKPDIDIEFLNIKGEPYLNRVWDKKNGIFSDSNYYEFIKRKDTIKLGENARLIIYLSYYLSNKGKGKANILLPKKEYVSKLKDDFSNWDSIKFDTVPNVAEYCKKHHIKYEQYDNFVMMVHFVYKTKGEKKIKGIVLEKVVKEDTIYYRKLFFTKKFYVQ